MDDLISRQAAIDAMNARLEDIQLTWRGKVKKGEIAMYLDMRGAIETLPSAQPEIIRCCDCIHFEYFEDQFVQMTRCDVHDRCPDYTDYCSWAERKE